MRKVTGNAAGTRRAILRWYARAKRDLPWRGSRDPYAILISEIMLQQTQVDRVIPKFTAFMRRFPTAASLARAPRADVLRAWSGLGYNRRALFLQQAAGVVARYGWPKTLEAMRALPGVGEYTAGAMLSFAFGQRTLAFDVNVQRVLRRAFVGVGPSRRPPTADRLKRLASRLMPRDSSTWQQALMDLGAMHCRATPKCATCPIRAVCPSAPAFLAGFAEKKASPAKTPFRDTARFVRGRIVALLTESAKGGSTIGRELAGHGVSRTRTVAALAALERDGIIRRRGALYAL